MSDRGHHGEGEHHQGDVTAPAMPGSALVVIEPALVFRGFKAVLDRPSMAFDATSASIDVPAGHQVVKKARSSSAMRRRISRPRVHKPSLALLNCSSSRSANSIYPQSSSPGPLVPAPADRRFQSDERRVRAMSAAVPATGGR